MKTNLLVGSLDISTLCSNTENCLSWLIILLDIFAIFYLVFVSFYKVTNFVRMIGWIWIGVLVTADVIIVAIHPCILTLLCVLFTIMIMTAMLSVVLPIAVHEEKYDEVIEKQKTKSKEKLGSYVIRETSDNRYCFEIYDKQDKFLVRSFNFYKSIADVKEAIVLTRRNGEIAEIEDRTVNWIKEANHPKFEMYKEEKSYYFKLSLDKFNVAFKSEAFESLQDCKKQLDKTILAVKSLAVYISIEKLSESEMHQSQNAKTVTFEEKQTKENIQSNLQVKAEEAKQEVKVDDGAVIINTTEKKTLWESYKELSEEQKNYFDGLRKAAQEKTGSREFESSVQLSYVLFRDKLMRLQIKRGVVEAIFMLMDSTFKQMQNSGDIKIKETKTVVRLENGAYYSLALETLNKKYDLIVEQKAEREDKRRKERLEKSRQKRLEQKGNN